MLALSENVEFSPFEILWYFSHNDPMRISSVMNIFRSLFSFSVKTHSVAVKAHHVKNDFVSMLIINQLLKTNFFETAIDLSRILLCRFLFNFANKSID